MATESTEKYIFYGKSSSQRRAEKQKNFNIAAVEKDIKATDAYT